MDSTVALWLLQFRATVLAYFLESLSICVTRTGFPTGVSYRHDTQFPLVQQSRITLNVP